jgi:hypothetical protein
VSENLTLLETEQISGNLTQRYGMRQENLKDIHNVLVDIWWDEDLRTALRYDLRLEGQDPIFNTGDGVLYARYQVMELTPQTIQPIPGCEIDLPLPDGFTSLIKLPGIIAYESAFASNETAAFYQEELPHMGWELIEGPQEGPDAILLSFRRGEEVLEINIETRQNESTVELILNP